MSGRLAQVEQWEGVRMLEVGDGGDLTQELRDPDPAHDADRRRSPCRRSPSLLRRADLQIIHTKIVATIT